MVGLHERRSIKYNEGEKRFSFKGKAPMQMKLKQQNNILKNLILTDTTYCIINDICQLLSAALKIIDEFLFLLKLLGNNLS